MRKSLYGFILAGLFVTGCKDAADKPATSPTTESGDTATAQGGDKTSGRTGKVDLGTRRRDRPALPDTAAGSDQVSKESSEDRRARRMSQFDTDGDGKISDDERKAARHKRADDMRAKADTNADGKVSVEELQASSGGFRRMDPATVDLDKDGNISTDELEKALEARAKQWGGDRRFGRARDRVRGPRGSGAPAPATGGEPPK